MGTDWWSCCWLPLVSAVQTQRQLQHSLEVHQRYIHSLMEQEGLAHRIPEMSAALAKGPAAPGAPAGPPSSVVSEAMPAQPAAGSNMQHQQMGLETGATSARAAAAAVHPSLPRYQDAAGGHAGSSGMHMGGLDSLQQQQARHHMQHQHQHQQRHMGPHNHAHGHQHLSHQQNNGTDEFLIPGELMPHPRQHNSMGGQLTTAAAAQAAAAAASDGGDLLGMGAGGGPHDDLGFLTDHDLHMMLGLPEDHDGLLHAPPDKRQRLLGPDDLV